MADFEKCYNTSQKMLATREHGKSEIEKKLIKKGFQIPIIREVIKELEENNYLSDERYSYEYIRMRKKKGYGEKKIFFELLNKGVDKKIIQENLKDFKDEEEVLIKAVEKKLNSKYLLDENKKIKLMRFFSSRGFEEFQVKKILKTYE